MKRSCLNCAHCKYVGLFCNSIFKCTKKIIFFDDHTFIRSIFCRFYKLKEHIK